MAVVAAALGPSVVLSFAVLLAAWVTREVWRRDAVRRPPPGQRRPSVLSPNPDGVRIALDAAATLNAYNIHAQNDPAVHLGAAARFTPLDYQSSVHEVSQIFRQGNVVTVDLAKMDDQEAARLVDFCSGLTAADAGWIFEVTERVIVITPVI